VRIRLIDELDRDSEASVQTLAERVGVTAYNASQQLAVLRGAGIVARRRRGREVLYRIADPTARALYDHVAAGLASQLRELDRQFGSDQDG